VKKPFWTLFRVRLLISHLVAVLLGLAAGTLFWATKGRELRIVNTDYAYGSLAQAGALAFHFGPAEQARGLLSQLPSDGFALNPASVMLAQVRLAVLSGEQLDSANATTHLDRAVAACARFSKDPCNLETMRGFARRVAKQRPD
jgi:hypothetical protein